MTDHENSTLESKQWFRLFSSKEPPKRSRSVLIGLLLLCVLYWPAQAQGPDKSETQQQANPQGEQYHAIYMQLVERAKKSDPTVDYVQMISAAMDWENAERHQIKPPKRDEMVAAFKAKKFEKAVEFAEIVLDYEFTNSGLHRAVENAYRKLRNTAKADFHREIGEKILQALLSTGDGKTAETAYCVQGINEEYVIMAHFGYEVSSQALILGSTSNYDFLAGKDKKTGKEVGLYFDISGHFSRCVQSHQQKKS